MWTRDLLKMNAKQVLRNNYWMALLVAFVASLLAGGSSNIGPTLTFIPQVLIITTINTDMTAPYCPISALWPPPHLASCSLQWWLAFSFPCL